MNAVIKRAKALRWTLGYRCAAGYLRNQGFEFEEAYRTLFGRSPRAC